MVIFMTALSLGVLIFVTIQYVGDKWFEFKVERFISCAEEFFAMYRILEMAVKVGNPDDETMEEFSFEGQNYVCDVKKGEMKSFYRKMLFVAEHVEKQYLYINANDFEAMDQDSYMKVQYLHNRLLDITNHIRCEYWKIKNT